MFIEFNPLKKAQLVILGDGHRLEATGRGVVDVQLIITIWSDKEADM